MPFLPPVSLDWRHQRKVGPVKNQGQCGSCWAFAATAVLESSHAIRTGGQLYSFAEQQFVSCIPENYGCFGCEGGESWAAFGYYIDNNHTLALERSWRYSASNGTCTYNSTGRTSI